MKYLISWILARLSQFQLNFQFKPCTCLYVIGLKSGWLENWDKVTIFLHLGV